MPPLPARTLILRGFPRTFSLGWRPTFAPTRTSTRRSRPSSRRWMPSVPEFKLTTDLSEEAVREALELLDGKWSLKVDEPYFDPAWNELPPTGSQRQAVLLTLVNNPSTRD